MESGNSEEGPGDRPHSAKERRILLEDLRALAMRSARLDAVTASRVGNLLSDSDAARSQDFLYDEFGLPEGGGDFAATDIPFRPQKLHHGRLLRNDDESSTKAG
jgi:hypothetical protein